MANAINTSTPCVPLYKNVFDTTLASVKNILILWDGGSTKKEIERSKNTLIANLIANLVVV